VQRPHFLEQRISGNGEILLRRKERLRGAADELLDEERRGDILEEVLPFQHKVPEKEKKHVAPVQDLALFCAAIQLFQPLPE